MMVVLHGLLPHWSGANCPEVSRHASSLHVIDAKAAYPAANWLQRGPDMPLRGF
jgi:phytanoyl-CoA hydroxylase